MQVKMKSTRCLTKNYIGTERTIITIKASFSTFHFIFFINYKKKLPDFFCPVDKKLSKNMRPRKKNYMYFKVYILKVFCYFYIDILKN